jgi:VanZ family protein
MVSFGFLASAAAMSALLSLLVLDPKLRKLRYGCGILMYAAIIGMGSIPGARAEIGNYASGLILHSLAYAVITFLLFTGSNGSARERALRAVLTVAAMGAFDEFVQSFLPYRNAAVSDWLVDCNAALITAALLWAFLPAPLPVKK